MTNEQLQKIIDQFDENELKQKGTFGIIQGSGADESYIRANKEGLECFALQLLKSAKDVEQMLDSKDKNTIYFETSEDWVDDNSSVLIQYIEIVSDKEAAKKQDAYKERFSDKLVPIGCGIILVFLGLSVLVGVWTILKWLF